MRNGFRTSEKSSLWRNRHLAQYRRFQEEKFNAYMPYMMVISQEENHIDWIGQLFAAYGLTSDGESHRSSSPRRWRMLTSTA